MAIEYFCCYHSYARKLAKLSDQEVGRLFRALLQYSETGETQELTGRESVAFDFIADDIDRARGNYETQCKRNSENGKKGGRPKKRPLSEKAPGFSKSEKSQSKYKNEYENENESKEHTLPPTPLTGGSVCSGTTPPTFPQVFEVAKLRGCPECAKPFFDYYDAAGWRDSEGKPCAWNWRQKLVAWQMRSQKRPDRPQSRNGNVFLDMLREEEGCGQG